MPRINTQTGASTSQDNDEVPNPPPMPPSMADAITTLVYATAENARLLREMAQNQQAPHPNHGRRNNGNDDFLGGSATLILTQDRSTVCTE